MRHSLLFLLIVTVGPLASQAVGQDADFDGARAELQAGRDMIIREDLILTDDERATFWPVYEAYVSDLEPLRRRKAEMIGRFVRAYEAGKFEDGFTRWLIEENFAIQEAWIDVQKGYLGRFSAVLPVQKVARFYQLENKMDAEVDAQLALAIPLVE